MLQASVTAIFRKYGITEGVLDADDSEKKRSKVTKRIFRAHKMKDNKTGGYIMGQNIVVLLLVTPLITVPVGFAFYMPDPALTLWYKNEDELKKKKIPKKLRPARPEKNPAYPTKQELVVQLIAEFKHYHPTIRVKLIAADNLYGSKEFIDKTLAIYGNTQIVSQLKSNQNVRFRNKIISVEEYFRRHPGVEYKITVRGGEEITVIVSSARLYVCSHQVKRFVIALKYHEERKFRYLVASDLSWRTLDIVQGYTFRWLVEVFFQDFKSYEGWGQLAKQTDEEGSSRGLILSLLLDHCLLFHPDQQARLENKLPAYTVGSLLEKTKVDCLLDFIRDIVSADNLQERLSLLSQSIEHFFKLASSKKHMNGRELPRLEPTPGLKYRARVCASYV